MQDKINEKITNLLNHGYQYNTEIFKYYGYHAWEPKLDHKVLFYIYKTELRPRIDKPEYFELVPITLLQSISVDNIEELIKQVVIFKRRINSDMIQVRAVNDIIYPPKDKLDYLKWYKYQEEFVVEKFY